MLVALVALAAVPLAAAFVAAVAPAVAGGAEAIVLVTMTGFCP